MAGSNGDHASHDVNNHQSSKSYNSSSALVQTWLKQTTKQDPWTTYSRVDTARVPANGQGNRLQALEQDMKQDLNRTEFWEYGQTRR